MTEGAVTSLAPARGGEGAADLPQWVVFQLAGCECALGIREVREIIRVGGLTRMPKAPKVLEGILNLRGRIVPVLDLRRRFGMPLVDRTDETRIMVVETAEQRVGFLVDKVSEVLRIPPEAVRPPEGPILTIRPEALEGVLPLEGNRLVLLLKLEALFELEEGKALADGPDRDRAT